ncbi:UDP-GalNAc:beta-1,3-N-acetylgalactosaminyltransferase 1-like [Mercenaria mercenaria]|uniref:UDP-GalNAc:beta-1, 3-N-acetylgalactosaminyltransferase 1-like n=1 Tax=Mercenaria mercenaria TaxID=6596 RepID=UPI00234F3445|nr:UDP-GalNAc:beta-1,3-N-acetylgalactosaminyltransferase 1-like [Mercenaria mercenaria]
MARQWRLVSLKSPLNIGRWKSSSLIAAISIILLFSMSIYRITDSILDRIAYPYNMYQGYPLSIYDNPFNIITNNTCLDNSRINIIIVIHSKVTNFVKRASIRQSWANKHLLSGYGVKVVFVLGLPYNNDIQALVHQESLYYNDIIQGTVYDSYTNITHKAVLWMRWVKEYCPNAPYVLKLDDDVFVNVFSLYNHILLNYKNTSMKMWCEVKDAGKQAISRLRGKKWRVASHELVGLKYYPLTFCRGYFVIMTQDSIGPMYETAKRTPFFWMDDYYVFGILANATGVKHSSLSQFLSDEDKAFLCFKSRTQLCPLLGALLESSDSDSMKTLWIQATTHVNNDFSLD